MPHHGSPLRFSVHPRHKRTGAVPSCVVSLHKVLPVGNRFPPNAPITLILQIQFVNLSLLVRVLGRRNRTQPSRNPQSNAFSTSAYFVGKLQIIPVVSDGTSGLPDSGCLTDCEKSGLNEVDERNPDWQDLTICFGSWLPPALVALSTTIGSRC